MQKHHNSNNKLLTTIGVCTILLGILIGGLIIIIQLKCYLNNIGKYTQEDKKNIEIALNKNDILYENYNSALNNLNLLKQKYQREIATISKNEINSSKYDELQQKISDISRQLEEIDQKKYQTLAEKNNLRTEYNNITTALEKKENKSTLVLCYIPGVFLVLASIIIGAYLLHISFKPDMDEVILAHQKKIDAENGEIFSTSDLPKIDLPTLKKQTKSKTSKNQKQIKPKKNPVTKD